MKLPDCAFNIDVKSAFTFWDPIILLGVTACQRGAGIKKHPVYDVCVGWYVWMRVSEVTHPVGPTTKPLSNLQKKV